MKTVLMNFVLVMLSANMAAAATLSCNIYSSKAFEEKSASKNISADAPVEKLTVVAQDFGCTGEASNYLDDTTYFVSQLVIETPTGERIINHVPGPKTKSLIYQNAKGEEITCSCRVTN